MTIGRQSMSAILISCPIQQQAPVWRGPDALDDDVRLQLFPDWCFPVGNLDSSVVAFAKPMAESPVARGGLRASKKGASHA
jgi:hypothetical protein